MNYKEILQHITKEDLKPELQALLEEIDKPTLDLLLTEFGGISLYLPSVITLAKQPKVLRRFILHKYKDINDISIKKTAKDLMINESTVRRILKN